MSKWNKQTGRGQKTKNYEGEGAYKLRPEHELYQRVCTASLQPSFYESEEERADRIRELLEQVEPEFAWKLASYARNQMGLRSVPVFLAVELTKLGHTSREGVKSVIQRADEITELLAYYSHANGLAGLDSEFGFGLRVTPLANSIKRAIRDVFEEGRFDEYQLAKYDRDGGVELRDALFLTHPDPQDEEQEELFQRLADSELETPETWEVHLTRAGQDPPELGMDWPGSKKEAWEDLIERSLDESGHLPTFATIRNLRNILQADVNREHIREVADRVSDEGFIKGTQIFPFRYFSAYQALQSVSHPGKKMLLSALEGAAKIASDNIPHFGPGESVLIATDTSGSMNKSISRKGSTRRVDIGLVLSNLLAHKCDWVRHIGFNTTLEKMPMHPDNPLGSASSYRPSGGGTNGHLVVEKMIEEDWDVDKVFVFSDMQLWNTDNAGFGRNRYSGRATADGSFAKAWRKYREEHPKTKCYLFDVTAYGTTPLNILGGDNAHLIAGWHTEVFNVLEKIENGEDALEAVREVEV